MSLAHRLFPLIPGLGLLFMLKAVPAEAQSEALREQAARIHRQVLTVDSHTDTPLQLTQKGFDMRVRHDPRKDFSKIDFPRMEEGGLDAAFFAVFLSQGPRDPEHYEKARLKALMIFDTLDAVVRRNSDIAGYAVTPQDAQRLEKEHRRALFLGIENGYAIGRDLSLISTFYLRGTRYITLCHTRNNDICDSSNDTVEHNGLSAFGRDVVKEMNHVGLMVDISHISDQAVRDVLKITEAPVIASHSCARALCDHPRNLTDDLLRAVARNGGVVQMCILSEYVVTPDPNPRRDSARAMLQKRFENYEKLSEEEKAAARKEWNEINLRFPQKLATVADVANHIDHLVRVAGINHVGIGTDFDGGGGVEGCFDASEMGNITLELVRRGYSAREIRKIWGGNLMRVMKQTARVAERYKRHCDCNG